MGRVAGPPSKSAEVRAWKRTVAFERRRRADEPPTPMLAVPSASRRQHALLWAIDCKGGELVVGRKGCPPYTRDMRELVRCGMLRLTRRHQLGIGLNVLVMTDRGRALIRRMPLDNAAVGYVVNALESDTLR